MVQNYELYFILNPLLPAEEIDVVIGKTEDLLNKTLNAQNLKTDKQGEKKLAYPIKKNWTGYYVLINFDLGLESASKLNEVEKFLNLQETVYRYLLVNQTDFNNQISKQELRETDVTSHRELNKGRKDKSCMSTYMNMRAVDYKDIDYLGQFVSPYGKIFVRTKTGSSAKFQRKISQAVKRARHMALLPFTSLYT